MRSRCRRQTKAQLLTVKFFTGETRIYYATLRCATFFLLAYERVRSRRKASRALICLYLRVLTVKVVVLYRQNAYKRVNCNQRLRELNAVGVRELKNFVFRELQREALRCGRG